MAVTIENKSSGIYIDTGSFETYIKYDNIKLSKGSTNITIYDNSSNSVSLGQYKITFKHSDVTLPVSDDLDALFDILEGYVDSSISNGVRGETSVVNSSIVPLVSGATFTGVAELNDYADVMITTKSDQNGTIYFEFSPDGTNWDTSLSFVYDTSRINPPHIFVKAERYFRVRFLNTSATDQTIFRINTYYGAFEKLTSPINGTVSDNYDALVVRPTDYRYEVAMGKRQGRNTVNKWGYNLDIDSGSGEEIIAPWGGTFNPNTDIMSVAQTFTITYNNATDGLGQTGALVLIITYIDANYNEITAFHTLGSTGTDTTSFTGFGINRVVVYTTGGLGWNAQDITLRASADSTIQAQVPAEKSVTQQCIYHTPINHNLLMDWVKGNVLKISGGGGNPTTTVVGYSWSRVTETRYEIFREDIDTNVENHMIVAPSQPFVVGGREVIYFECSTDTNNTVMKFRFSGILERIL